jgi:sigma-B regulation protein RsbU (phosphoserine phosphatase)
VTERAWYIGAARTRSIYFTGLQQDIFTGRKEIVCAYPVYHDGELVAVAGADLFLEAMEEAIMETGESAGFVCIVDQNGHVIFSPQRSGTFAPALSDSVVDLRESANADLAAFASKAMKVSTEVERIQVDGTDYYMTGYPIGSIGWALLSVVDVPTVHAPVDMMTATHDEIVGESASIAERNADRSQAILLILLLATMVLALSAALTLAKRIVSPINEMAREVASLNDNNPLFRMKNEYRTDDEIEVLAESFADISAKTQTYIRHITEITAEKERIGTELELATKIQADMLPNIFPPFPGRKELDIFATMEPAKEVGGDFYDFFLIDDDHLAMVMADVSGKGVPAALFMMMSKILVNNNTMLCDFPNEVLERVNDQICKNNEEDMFVTVWLGILTISTGHVVASNAGHEYPVIKKKEGEFEILKDRHSFVIGGMPDISYRKYDFELEHGGTLFLYTDGVPETTDSDNVLFGTDRMLEVLNREPEADASKVIHNVYAALKEFAGDAPQFDDITMMAIKLR